MKDASNNLPNEERKAYAEKVGLKVSKLINQQFFKVALAMYKSIGVESDDEDDDDDDVQLMT